jgi:hypothetical protein
LEFAGLFAESAGDSSATALLAEADGSTGKVIADAVALGMTSA